MAFATILKRKKIVVRQLIFQEAEVVEVVTRVNRGLIIFYRIHNLFLNRSGAAENAQCGNIGIFCHFLREINFAQM